MTGSKRLGKLVQQELTRKAKWHTRFFRLAQHIAGWSKDPSMKVAAVIVDEEHHILAHGYNGFPRGVKDTEERYEDRSLKYPMVVHAEVNAVLAAGHDLTGATLYSTAMPCPDCMGVIIQAGIKTVVFPPQFPTDQKKGKGKVDYDKLGEITQVMADEAEVELIEILDT